jgi:hypothetical protein
MIISLAIAENIVGAGVTIVYFSLPFILSKSNTESEYPKIGNCPTEFILANNCWITHAASAI